MAAEDSGASGFRSSNGRIPAGGVEFFWTLEVRPLESLPQGGVRNEPNVLNEVQAAVRRNGSTRERSLTTYVTTGRRRSEDPTK